MRSQYEGAGAVDEYIAQNRTAWEHDAYHFWVKQYGLPSELARKMIEKPRAMLRKYAQYFKSFEGSKIASICGSCGKKAIPLALLGAQVTIFDISDSNKRYACETAAAANTEIDYVVGDVLGIDLAQYGGYFDIVFMEGGILHYFHDIDQFFHIMHGILRSGGKMICSDFHPFQKIVDILEFGQSVSNNYFSTEIIEAEMAHARFYPEEERKKFPLCSIRKYTLSEIINSVIDSGFVIKHFDEHPAWTNSRLPGEFTIIAYKD